MAILRITEFVEFYRHLANTSELHALAGHGDRAAGEWTNSRILAALQLNPEDTLLDIGCGDGSLLKAAQGNAARCIGVVPTIEEQARLQAALPSLTFVTGLAQSLALPAFLSPAEN